MYRTVTSYILSVSNVTWQLYLSRAGGNINYALKKILADRIQQHFKGLICYDEMGFIPRLQECFILQKSISVIHHADRMKGGKPA